MAQRSITVQQKPLPIHQDNFTPSRGNALQACVASIFGQPLDRVPNFISLECGYFQGIVDYVQGVYDVEKKTFQTTNNDNSSNGSNNSNGNSNSNGNVVNDDDDVGKLCIVRGKSPRGDFAHVVVGRIRENGTIEMLHDPHPDGTYLDDSESFGWYMTFDQVTAG